MSRRVLERQCAAFLKFYDCFSVTLLYVKHFIFSHLIPSQYFFYFILVLGIYINILKPFCKANEVGFLNLKKYINNLNG